MVQIQAKQTAAVLENWAHSLKGDKEQYLATFAKDANVSVRGTVNEQRVQSDFDNQNLLGVNENRANNPTSKIYELGLKFVSVDGGLQVKTNKLFALEDHKACAKVAVKTDAQEKWSFLSNELKVKGLQVDEASKVGLFGENTPRAVNLNTRNWKNVSLTVTDRLPEMSQMSHGVKPGVAAEVLKYWSSYCSQQTYKAPEGVKITTKSALPAKIDDISDLELKITSNVAGETIVRYKATVTEAGVVWNGQAQSVEGVQRWGMTDKAAQTFFKGDCVVPALSVQSFKVLHTNQTPVVVKITKPTIDLAPSAVTLTKKEAKALKQKEERKTSEEKAAEKEAAKLEEERWQTFQVKERARIQANVAKIQAKEQTNKEKMQATVKKCDILDNLLRVGHLKGKVYSDAAKKAEAYGDDYRKEIADRCAEKFDAGRVEKMRAYYSDEHQKEEARIRAEEEASKKAWAAMSLTQKAWSYFGSSKATASAPTAQDQVAATAEAAAPGSENVVAVASVTSSSPAIISEVAPTTEEKVATV